MAIDFHYLYRYGLAKIMLTRYCPLGTRLKIELEGYTQLFSLAHQPKLMH